MSRDKPIDPKSLQSLHDASREELCKSLKWSLQKLQEDQAGEEIDSILMLNASIRIDVLENQVKKMQEEIIDLKNYKDSTKNMYDGLLIAMSVFSDPVTHLEHTPGGYFIFRLNQEQMETVAKAVNIESFGVLGQSMKSIPEIIDVADRREKLKREREEIDRQIADQKIRDERPCASCIHRWNTYNKNECVDCFDNNDRPNWTLDTNTQQGKK